jgi:hypothetical protein
MASVPKIYDVFNAFCSEESCIKWLLERSIVKIPICCGKSMINANIKNKKYMYRCDSGQSCTKKRSLFTNTFFGNSKLSCHKILLICYLWASEINHKSMVMITGQNKNTISDWMGFIRQLVSEDMQNSPEEVKVGGEGIIVEIDETKIAKRKYHRGHRVEGAWVVGGVERTPERKFFAVRVPDRSAATLIDVIDRFVLPGSILYSDCWGGYNTQQLEALGITHLTVNHSLHYKDPVTGVHTNTIEGTWAGLKLVIPKRQRSGAKVDDHLDVFVWRRLNEGNWWGRLLDLIKDAKYEQD